jgi:O-antigen ligase
VPTDPQAIVYVVLVYTVMIACLISVATNVDGDVMLRSLMATVAVTQGLMLIWVLKDHDYSWGRLFGRVQPNYWGQVAQAAILAAIAMRGVILRAGVVGVSLFVLYATQSRGSMVAMAVGLLLAFILFTATSRWRAQLWVAAVIGAVFVGLMGSGFIANDLFKVSDPLRGAGSGMTGRAAAWSETMDLIANHPWVGVGYRQHEKFLTTEVSAHNAYLATTADTGVFGLFAYMLFLGGGLWRSCLKALRRPSPASLACAAYLIGFMVDGLFERSALNTGNAFCQLMILVAAWAWRQDDLPLRRP